MPLLKGEHIWKSLILKQTNLKNSNFRLSWPQTRAGWSQFQYLSNYHFHLISKPLLHAHKYLHRTVRHEQLAVTKSSL